MKDILLHIWDRLTGLWKNQGDDQYEITEVKEFSEEENLKWIQEINQQYEKELETRRNRNVEFVWSLVGNIIGDHPTGENKVIKRGTKHFSPGTKVYCFPPQWGDGYEKIYVMGRPRQRSGFIKVVINSDLVINWRIQKVFAPRIRKEMIRNNGWNETDESKERILTLLNSIVENRGGHERIS